MNLSPGGIPWGGFMGQIMGAGGQQAGMDTAMGGMMARGMAAGAPMLQGAMGAFGMDPMSLGLRAASSVYGKMGMGVMGAGAVGMGVAGGAGALMAGGQYIGSQMYQGGQQQGMLNQTMRSNFNFTNQLGGRGFTNQQSASIGQHMRGMTHDSGPGGEITGFAELTKLAGNMGKMGMAQGVTSVTEFKDKFKQMVDTLKKVATDMGSSLEEAQKFIHSVKGAGVFQKADQLRMSAGVRGMAAAGGLAMSEVTGMASIGSQISRSVGGLGRSGAFGGMLAIGQVGTAMKNGALSEEDIYNATGQTGAEGRQAFTSNMMGKSADFLKSGRGRRFLASVAGKDGNLNEDAVAEWMGGGMSTGRTMELAGQNLNGVGRANFIRNEGRLRGGALEKFGMMAPTMAYSQWLESRGHKPGNMDDRSMLAFQRFSGLGRDEADAAIKMVDNLPEMMRTMSRSGQDDKHNQRVQDYKKGQGLSGLSKNFEKAREGLQGKLQQIGADMFSAGSDTLEAWSNKVSGQYVQHFSEQADRAWRTSRGSGAVSNDAYNRVLGGGKTGGGGLLSGPSAQQRFFGDKGGMTGDAATKLGLLSSDSDRFQKAGYSFSAKAHTDEKTFDYEMKRNMGAHKAATQDAKIENLQFAKKHENFFTEMFADKSIQGSGEKRIDSITKYLKKKGGDESNSILKELRHQGEIGNNADSLGNKVGLITAAADVIGQGKEERQKYLAPDVTNLFSASMGASEGDRADKISDYLYGSNEAQDLQKKRDGESITDYATGKASKGRMISGGARALVLAGTAPLEGIGAGAKALGLSDDLFGFGAQQDSLRGSMDDYFTSKEGGSGTGARRGLGKFADSDEGINAARDMIGRNAESREDALKKTSKRMADLNRKDSLTDDEKGERDFLEMTTMAQEYGDAAKDPDKIAGLAKKHGLSPEAFEQRAKGVFGLVDSKNKEEFYGATKKYGKIAADTMDNVRTSGLATWNDQGEMELDSKTADELTAKGGAAGQGYVASILEATQAESKMHGGAGDEEYSDKGRASRKMAGEQGDNMTVQQKLATATIMRKKGLGDQADELNYVAGLQKKMSSGGNKGLADALGISMDQQSANKLFAGGSGDAAKQLAQAQGIDTKSKSGQAYMEDLQNITEKFKGGDKAGAARLAANLGGSDALKEAKLKKQEKDDPQSAAIKQNTAATAKAAEGSMKLLALIAGKTASAAEIGDAVAGTKGEAKKKVTTP